MIERLRSLFPAVALEPGAATDQPTLVVPANDLIDVCRTLQTRTELAFILLADVTAVDWWPREPRYEVVYHLASMTERLRLKVRLGSTSPRVPTLQGIWAAAGWLEREVWDMFGIIFDGHGDLRRLLMPEDWEGYPLRKDFPVQIRLRPRSDSPLQVSEEEFRANLERDKASRGGLSGKIGA
jgi:NADH-quinone oxidoreductase subunit C